MRKSLSDAIREELLILDPKEKEERISGCAIENYVKFRISYSEFKKSEYEKKKFEEGKIISRHYTQEVVDHIKEKLFPELLLAEEANRNTIKNLYVEIELMSASANLKTYVTMFGYEEQIEKETKEKKLEKKGKGLVQRILNLEF